MIKFSAFINKNMKYVKKLFKITVMEKYQNKITRLLKSVDIDVNGSRPWDIQIHNPDFYRRALSDSTISLGESYMDGWWDCEALDQLFFRVMRGISMRDVYSVAAFLKLFLKNILTNQQTRWRSKKVAKQHYNIGNQLYQYMLGDSMAYTCAYWRDAENLTQAQEAKYDLVCRKLQLEKGERVLELGCGWGGFAYYAAKHYGVEMVSVNISTEQLRYARELCKDLPVNLVESDYRDIENYNPSHQQFDKVVSIGMCEHVGYKNYNDFIQVARQQLKSDGLFLMHTIGKNHSVNFADPWIQKYIFPNGMLPTVKWISEATEDRFIIEDIHNFGADYDRTLMAWDENFVKHWGEIKKNYDERFYRMWRYYLLSCAGAFRARSMQLYQFLLSPNGKLGGYVSIR